MKFQILIKTIIILTFFSSCVTPTVEEQVEQIFIEKDRIERKEIVIDLAKTENIKVINLINKHYVDNLNLTEEALENLLYGYSQMLNNNNFENSKNIYNCIKLITEPDTTNLNSNINNSKIKYIICALSIQGTKEFENCLIISANKHGDKAMKEIIETWENGNNSIGLWRSIIAFKEKSIIYLSNQLGKNEISEDLLARIGDPAVDYLKLKMQDPNQSVRFAAADALVKMIEYHPNALKKLTDALNEESLNVISYNYPFYIRLGIKGSEEILLKALDINFSQEMGVDFLNCGNSELESKTIKIANKHGYTIMPGFGESDGPKWGSDKTIE